MSEHIDRIRAFAHWIAQGKGHATQEAVDAMALLADYDALAARLAEVDALRDWQRRAVDALKCPYPGNCRNCRDSTRALIKEAGRE